MCESPQSTEEATKFLLVHMPHKTLPHKLEVDGHIIKLYVGDYFYQFTDSYRILKHKEADKAVDFMIGKHIMTIDYFCDQGLMLRLEQKNILESCY